MKKLCFAFLTGFLVISSLTLNAGEKRYRIQLVSTDGDVYGQPVAFQEIAPVPSPAPAPAPLFVPTPAPEFAPPS
ncbi:MAG: hypothetical protein KDA84_25865, partial [Planctomycetaceae bacterium]|nr:hypothetical protein [Planctomycetaceae bacterium]